MESRSDRSEQRARPDITIEVRKEGGKSDSEQHRAQKDGGSRILQTAKEKVIALEQHAVKDLKEIAHVARDAIALPEAPYGPPGYVSPDPDRYGHLSHEEKLHLLENREKYRDQQPPPIIVYDGPDDSYSSAVVRGATGSIPLWRNESANLSSSEIIGSERRMHDSGSGGYINDPTVRKTIEERSKEVIHGGAETPYARGATETVPLWRTGDSTVATTPTKVTDYTKSSEITDDRVHKILDGGSETPYGRGATETVPLWQNDSFDDPNSVYPSASIVLPRVAEPGPAGSEAPSFSSAEVPYSEGATMSVPLWRNEADEAAAKQYASSLAAKARAEYAATKSSAAEDIPAGSRAIRNEVSQADTSIRSTASQAADTVKEKATAVADSAAHLKEKAADGLHRFQDTVQDSANHALSEVGETKDAIVDRTRSAEDYVARKAHDVKDAVAGTARYAAGQISDQAHHAEEATTSSLRQAKEKAVHVKDDVKDKAEGARDYVAEKVHRAEDSVRGGLEKTTHKAVEVKDSVANTARRVEETVKEDASAMAHKAADKAVQIKNAVVGSVSDTAKATKGTLEHVVEKAKDVKDQAAQVLIHTAEDAKEAAQKTADVASRIESSAMKKADTVVRTAKSTVESAEKKVSKTAEKIIHPAEDALETVRAPLATAAQKTEQIAAAAIEEGKRVAQTAKHGLEVVGEEISDTTSSVLGVAAEKVSEFRAQNRSEMEKRLASESERPMEDRVEHANLALQYQLEQRDHVRRKEEYERRLADSKVGHAVSQAVSQARPYPTHSRFVVDEVVERATEISDKASRRYDEMKNAYHLKRDELQQKAHDQFIHGSHPVADAAYAAMEGARTLKKYVEDTGSWMKSGVKYMTSEAQDRLESASGMMKESSKEYKHAANARTDSFKAQFAPNEQAAAKFSDMARAEEEERQIHRANKEQHWENLTYVGKLRQRVSTFFFGRGKEEEHH